MNKIFKAGLAVGAAHVLFKLAGFIQARVMAQRLPDATYDSVYAVAFENCIFTLFLIGEEVIGPAFLPVFMSLRNKEENSALAWPFASAFLLLHLLILGGVVAALELIPLPQGFEHVRGLAPALIFLSLSSTTYVILNARKKFFLAAFGDAAWKFAVIIALLLAGFFAADYTRALILGLVAGSVLKLLTHLIGLGKDSFRLFRPRFSAEVFSGGFKPFFLLALPLIAGIIFAKFRDITNNVVILSALDTPGLMKANSLGRKLPDLIRYIIPYTLSIAVFPFFCEWVDRGERSAMGDFITRSCRQMLALFIPLSALVAALALPLTTIAFSGGEFGKLAAERTAVSTACYIFALPAAALETILMQAFFAHRRTLLVTILGIVFSSVSIIISWLGLKLCGANELLVLAAIGGGFAISRLLKTTVLGIFLKRDIPCFPAKSTLLFVLRIVIVSAFVFATAFFAQRLISGSCVTKLFVGALGGGAAGFVACLVLRVREPFELVKLCASSIFSKAR